MSAVILAIPDEPVETVDGAGNIIITPAGSLADRWQAVCDQSNADVFSSESAELLDAIEQVLTDAVSPRLGAWLTKQVEARVGPCPELGSWVSAHTDWRYTWSKAF